MINQIQFQRIFTTKISQHVDPELPQEDVMFFFFLRGCPSSRLLLHQIGSFHPIPSPIGCMYVYLPTFAIKTTIIHSKKEVEYINQSHGFFMGYRCVIRFV